MKNKYFDIIIFCIKLALIGYLFMNIYTYFKFSAFVPISIYFITLGILLPVGLIFVFQFEHHKQQMRKKYPKIFEELKKQENE